MERREFILGSVAALATNRLPRLRRAAIPAVSRVEVDPRRLQHLLEENARALGIVGAQLAVFDGKQVLSPAAVRTMHTPQVRLPTRVIAQQWCAGPYWKQWGSETIYGHSGTNTSGSSMLLWIPAKNLAIATIANVPNQGYPLADRIFDTVFPEMFGIAKPKSPTAATVTRAKVDLRRYIGRFEAYGTVFEFTDNGGRLMARALYTGAFSAAAPAAETGLIPLGEDRFLPTDPAMGGNRGWDMAFWGSDSGGRATHFLNGVFGMRRVG